MGLKDERIDELKVLAKVCGEFDFAIGQLSHNHISFMTRGAGEDVYGGRTVVMRTNFQALKDHHGEKLTIKSWLAEAQSQTRVVDKVAAARKFMGVNTWQSNINEIDHLSQIEMTRIFQKM